MKLARCGAAATVLLGLLMSSPSVATAQQDPETCPPAVGLTNSSFEQPDVRGPWLGPQSSVPGWSTTAGDKVIEIWGPGNAGANHGVEVPAVTGDQFAELNATQASTLYQDVATTPGQTLRWRISHRARNVSPAADRDTMNVLIGTTADPRPQTPTGAGSPDIVDDDTAWGHWTGDYEVPPGQTTTRFAFKAVSTASGNRTLGNFLDGIEFGTSACLITAKSATGPGDDLTYTLKVTNAGGAAALDAVVTDPIPDGAEYVADSTTLDGKPVPDSGSGSGEVGVPLPSPFEAGATATITFKAKATGNVTPLKNTATTDFTDGLTGEKDKSTSNTTENPVTVPSTTTAVPPVDGNGGGAATGGLPNTGASIGTGLTAAVLLLGLGPGLTIFARRRTKA